MNHASFEWFSLPLPIELFTIVVALVFILYTVAVWQAWDDIEAKAGLPAETKTLGVTAIGGFITVGVAAASILLTGTGVLLALEPSHQEIPTKVFTVLTLAVVWLVVSLVAGILAAAWIVNHANHDRNVIEHPLVMAAASAQFLSLIFGAVYFVLAIFLL